MLKSRLLSSIPPAALALITLSPPASAQVRTFNEPTHQGAPVAYCGLEPESCGETVATMWCESQGYQTATDWSARAGVDAGSKTVRLVDGAVCTGASCESFAAITCRRQGEVYTMPVLGPSATNATVLSPNLRSTEVSLDLADFQVLMPGCFQREPGVFMCESVYEYQHCRTLMISRMVYSCRIGRAFESAIAEPRLAEPGDYELDVDADVRVRIDLGDRGRGQVKGDAKARVRFDPPALADGEVCLQRERYIYHTTGPDGGVPDIGEPDSCDEPIELAFEPHEDDLLRAYDLCDSFAAWGEQIDDSIDVLAAGLFQIASPGGVKVIAPYLTVKARMSIECRL